LNITVSSTGCKEFVFKCELNAKLNYVCLFFRLQFCAVNCWDILKPAHLMCADDCNAYLRRGLIFHQVLHK